MKKLNKKQMSRQEVKLWCWTNRESAWALPAKHSAFSYFENCV